MVALPRPSIAFQSLSPFIFPRIGHQNFFSIRMAELPLPSIAFQSLSHFIFPIAGHQNFFSIRVAELPLPSITSHPCIFSHPSFLYKQSVGCENLLPLQSSVFLSPSIPLCKNCRVSEFPLHSGVIILTPFIPLQVNRRVSESPAY